MDNFSKEVVYFNSGDEKCEAWLYRPEIINNRHSSPPIIVMAHGLGAIKELRLGAFAERFCKAGYACLVFDYRYFGGSTGYPRQLLDIKSQLEDWKAAVKFATKIEGVDSKRVIVWGTSFGGGHAIITAAENQEIVAAIVQCPFTDGVESVLAIPPVTTGKLSFLAMLDIFKKYVGLKPHRVKVAGEPGENALMTSKDSMPGYHALINSITDDALLKNRAETELVPARIVFQIPFHRPGLRVKDVKCPILFCICENDSVAPAKKTIKYAKTAPNGELKLYPDGHFEIYLGKPFELIVADQLSFLIRNVPLS